MMAPARHLWFPATTGVRCIVCDQLKTVNPGPCPGRPPEDGAPVRPKPQPAGGPGAEVVP